MVKIFFLVQADKEKDYGVNPVDQSRLSIFDNKHTSQLYCVHKLEADDENKYKKFSKIQNIFIYKKLGLKTAPIYVLDNNDEFKKLAEGNISNELRSDLANLVTNSLVIRVDIDSNDKDQG